MSLFGSCLAGQRKTRYTQMLGDPGQGGNNSRNQARSPKITEINSTLKEKLMRHNGLYTLKLSRRIESSRPVLKCTVGRCFKGRNKDKLCRAHWSTPLNPALRRQRPADLCEFETSLVYREIPCLKQTRSLLSWKPYPEDIHKPKRVCFYLSQSTMWQGVWG